MFTRTPLVFTIIWQRSDHFLRRATSKLGNHLTPSAVWKKGWDGRFAPPKVAAPLLGSNRVLIRNLTRRENKKAPQRGLFIFWRRGWDSNPRYGRTVHLISNQAHSTTLAPLHWSAVPFTPASYRSTAWAGDSGEQFAECQGSIHSCQMQ